MRHILLIAFCLIGLLVERGNTPGFCQTQKPELVVQMGHTAAVWSTSFSPDGRTVVTTSFDHTAKLWDIATGALLHTFTGHTDVVWSATFSPDSRMVMTTSFDHTAKLWNIATGALLRTLKSSIGDIRSASFSLDSRTVLTAGYDGMMQLWNVQTGTPLPLFQPNDDALEFADSASFSPDGKIVAAVNFYTYTLWDARTGALLHTIDQHTREVWCLSFSPDGKTLVTASDDKTAKLWDVRSGQLLHTLDGHSQDVTAAAFSPDSRTVVTASKDGKVILWDVVTGALSHMLTGHGDAVRSASFNPNGETLVTASDDKTAKLWNARTGVLAHTLKGHASNVHCASFSPDGLIVLTGSDDGTARLWDAQTGVLLHTLSGRTGLVVSASFGPDGRTAVTASKDNTANLWDLQAGLLSKALTGHTGPVLSALFSPNGRGIVTASLDKTAKIWNAQTGALLLTLHGHTNWVISASFSPDGRTVLTASLDHTARLWDLATGMPLHTLNGHTGFVASAMFSPDGRTVITSSQDKTAKLWDAASGTLLHTLAGHHDEVWSAAFSPNGRMVVSASRDATAKLWDVHTGTLLHTLVGNVGPDASVGNIVTSASFSPDSRVVVTTSGDGSADFGDNKARLWNVATGALLHTLSGHQNTVNTAAFSPNGRMLVTASKDHTARLWDVESGVLLHTLEGHLGDVHSASFSPDGRVIITGSYDGSIRFWHADTGAEFCAAYGLDKGDWVVVAPDGRFDASPGGLAQMHYVVSLEPIELDQLKDRYYEPGLLAKLLGFNKEPLRDVQAFDHVDLYPAVNAPDAVPADGRLPLTLTNRGGGIGRIQVFVNDKELIADARGLKPDPNAQTASLTVDVSHAPGLIPGKPNTVRVVTWNAEGYLSSRGTEAVYCPPGRSSAAPPDLWAIVGGISDYAGPALHLTYPAKDAADFAHALTLAAKNLFGAANVHLTLLDTDETTGAVLPTKTNLRKAFETARRAKPGDIFVVYLAGHGVALPGEHDLYCYLTQDATTGNPAVLSADAQLRAATTVSSEELTDWIKQVPAQKQVMVLDTCAAGAAAALLTAKRDVPSDQIRAIERLKDRTGFYVLMGCAADAVSYETSQYRQGLLTYSLLKGMKGASLRDGQYVDVSSLFNYAVDEVPALAQNIGGVQRPFVAAPAAGSFDVGELSAADRQAIPLATAGALLLRPELVAEDEDLNLESLLAARLRDAGDASARGAAAAPALSFLDAADFPGAVQPRGVYSVTGDQIRVTLKLRRDGTDLATIKISGSKGDVPGLVSKLAAAILGAIKPQ